jgi:sec-independent protein translocase protein TatA
MSVSFLQSFIFSKMREAAIRGGSLTFREDSSTFCTAPIENTLEEVPMFLFGPVGPTELILIVLIVVIIFGARRLPELGKSLGEGIKNFKRSITSKEKESDSKDESEPSSKDQ